MTTSTKFIPSAVEGLSVNYQKGLIHLILLIPVLIVAIIAIIGFILISQGFLKLPSTQKDTEKQPASQAVPNLREVYQNPFETSNEYKNPFDNLK